MAEEVNPERPKHHSTPKEITIRLNHQHLKLGLYLLVVLALVGVIVAQQYGHISTRNSAPAAIETEEETSEIVGIIEEENETTEPEAVVVQEEVETVEENTTEETEEDDTLSITGEITLTVENVKIDIKGEDYARLVSVTYKIINQDKDIIPTIKGRLTSDDEDIKEIQLPEIEAGTTYSKTETKLTFGYNDIDTEKTLKLDLYDAKGKLLKSTTYKFDTE